MSTPNERSDADAVGAAVCTLKGGVGKTLSTINLSRAGSLQGLRVLVCDLDPQGNTTSALSAEELPESAPGAADVLTPHSSARTEVGDVIVPTVWKGVDLLPSPSLEALDEVSDQVASMRAGRERQLSKALGPVRKDYDLILIDNNASMGILLINALVEALRALVVTQPEQWAIDGLAAVHSTVDEVHENYNPALEVMGPMVNLYDPRASAHAHALTELAEVYGPSPWNGAEMDSGPVRPDGVLVPNGAIIPMRTAVRDYPLAGLGIDENPKPWAQDVAHRYGWIVRQIVGGGRG